MAKADFIYSIAQTSGGWEGWLQVEMAHFLLEQGIAAKREVHVWEDERHWTEAVQRWACDFLVRGDTYDFIVELKCLSLGQVRMKVSDNGQRAQYESTPAGLDSFVNGICRDAGKIAMSRLHGISIVVIPIFNSTSSTTLDGALKTLKENHYEIQGERRDITDAHGFIKDVVGFVFAYRHIQTWPDLRAMHLTPGQ